MSRSTGWWRLRSCAPACLDVAQESWWRHSVDYRSSAQGPARERQNSGPELDWMELRRPRLRASLLTMERHLRRRSLPLHTARSQILEKHSNHRYGIGLAHQLYPRHTAHRLSRLPPARAGPLIAPAPRFRLTLWPSVYRFTRKLATEGTSVGVGASSAIGDWNSLATGSRLAKPPLDRPRLRGATDALQLHAERGPIRNTPTK